jgi:cytoskeletal protein RodZ
MTTVVVNSTKGGHIVGEAGAAATTTTQSLGGRLRQARELRRLSISAVAKEAEISTAYLQKLEVDDVRKPSPNVLYSLSEVLGIDYAELMRLAGYMVPNHGQSRRRRNELTHAFSSEELNEDEAEILAEYLLWYRTRQQQPK